MSTSIDIGLTVVTTLLRILEFTCLNLVTEAKYLD
jgi:hypothetical protein